MNKAQHDHFVIPLLFVVSTILMVAVMPREGQFKYQYQKGSPWMYENLDASFDFPILKTEEELRLEREKAAKYFTPYFSIKSDIEAEQLRAFSAAALDAGLPDMVSGELLSFYKELYGWGIMDETRYNQLDPEIGIAVLSGKIAEKRPVSEIYTIPSAYNYLLQKLTTFNKNEINTFNHSRLELMRFLVPNLIYDEATTLAVQSTMVQDISLTKGIVYAGQRIISQGEVVTGSTEQVLNSLREEYNSKIGFSGSLVLLVIGQSFLIALCLLLLFILIRTLRPVMLSSVAELSFILSLCVLVVMAASGTYKANPAILYLLPFPVIVLFLDSFFPTRVSLPLFIAAMLPLTFITDDYKLVIGTILAGGVAVFAFRSWGRGWQQFLSVLLVFICYILVDLSFHLISEGNFLGIHASVFRNYAIASVLLVACYPFVFILEKLFGFVSLSRLRELADTGNKVLRELSEKAPGTMQHSLQVANLAESAARNIGAYALLCRVGALYHDIGKINNPQYFIENQAAGFNPHTLLAPQESARIVIQHVEDGKSLAKKYGLPALVGNFIESHHGQTKTEYFYTEYCNTGGDPANVEDFTYKGALPASKEQVIVMMADAVEAACRSLKDYTP
ncbi:MAG TPA: HDIG domain-containing protein, partial [Bacteroidales bacterium]|nr:HDIG domain-containing protein [Bacteroidales bacterium]